MVERVQFLQGEVLPLEPLRHEIVVDPLRSDVGIENPFPQSRVVCPRRRILTEEVLVRRIRRRDRCRTNGPHLADRVIVGTDLADDGGRMSVHLHYHRIDESRAIRHAQCCGPDGDGFQCLSPMGAACKPVATYRIAIGLSTPSDAAITPTVTYRPSWEAIFALA